MDRRRTPQPQRNPEVAIPGGGTPGELAARNELQDFTPIFREGVAAGGRLSVPPSDNFVANGDFETTDLSHFDVADGVLTRVFFGPNAQDPDTPHGLQMTVTENSFAAFTKWYYGYNFDPVTALGVADGAIPVSPGDTVAASVDAFVQLTSRPLLGFTLTFAAADGTDIDGSVAADLFPMEQNTWRKYQVAAIAPEGAAMCYVAMQVITPRVFGEDYFFDNLVVGPAGGFTGPTQTKSSGLRVVNAGDRMFLKTDHPLEWAGGNVRPVIRRNTATQADDQFGAQLSAPRSLLRSPPAWLLQGDSDALTYGGFAQLSNAIAFLTRGVVGLELAMSNVADDTVAVLNTLEQWGTTSATQDMARQFGQPVTVVAFLIGNAFSSVAAAHTAWSQIEISFDGGATWDAGPQRRTHVGNIAGAAISGTVANAHFRVGFAAPTGTLAVRARAKIRQQGGVAGNVTWENGTLYLVSIPTPVDNGSVGGLGL